MVADTDASLLDEADGSRAVEIDTLLTEDALGDSDGRVVNDLVNDDDRSDGVTGEVTGSEIEDPL